MADNDATMEDMVFAVLDSPITKSKIAFRVGMIFIGPSYYSRVQDAFRDGAIELRYSDRLRNKAKYRPGKNRLTVGFRETKGKPDREALLLHELTHVAHDIRGIPRLVLHSEASAYIAQALYFYYRNESVLKAGHMAPSFGDKILSAAWDVSKLARKKPSVLSDSDAKPLFNAIKKHGAYKNSYNQDYEFDGV